MGTVGYTNKENRYSKIRLDIKNLAQTYKLLIMAAKQLLMDFLDSEQVMTLKGKGSSKYLKFQGSGADHSEKFKVDLPQKVYRPKVKVKEVKATDAQWIKNNGFDTTVLIYPNEEIGIAEEFDDVEAKISAQRVEKFLYPNQIKKMIREITLPYTENGTKQLEPIAFYYINRYKNQQTTLLKLGKTYGKILEVREVKGLGLTKEDLFVL